MARRLGSPILGQLENAASLAQASKIAKTAIDDLAEKKRQTWLTPGAGQAQEYIHTRAEAERYQSGDADADYPYLLAEVAALQEVGQTTDMATVAENIQNLSAALDVASAMIKQYRRTAKIQIAAATEKSEVIAIYQQTANDLRQLDLGA